MYSIRVEGDSRELIQAMKNIAELDRAGLNEALGEGVRTSTVERFKRSRGPDGKRWRTSVRAATTGGTTLVDTAQLRNSITSKSDDSGFAVGTNAKHAATHQFGDTRTIQAKRAKALRFRIGDKWVMKKKVKVTFPARPFLGLDDEDMEEIKATIDKTISREV